MPSDRDGKRRGSANPLLSSLNALYRASPPPPATAEPIFPISNQPKSLWERLVASPDSEVTPSMLLIKSAATPELQPLLTLLRAEGLIVQEREGEIVVMKPEYITTNWQPAEPHELSLGWATYLASYCPRDDDDGA